MIYTDSRNKSARYAPRDRTKTAPTGSLGSLWKRHIMNISPKLLHSGGNIPHQWTFSPTRQHPSTVSIGPKPPEDYTPTPLHQGHKDTSPDAIPTRPPHSTSYLIPPHSRTSRRSTSDLPPRTPPPLLELLLPPPTEHHHPTAPPRLTSWHSTSRTQPADQKGLIYPTPTHTFNHMAPQDRTSYTQHYS
jgi:hypothetical protein